MSEISEVAVVRWRRKPEPDRRDEQIAAKYVPGDLSGVLAVARMCDSQAEVAEVAFQDESVLIVRYNRYSDNGHALDFEEVRPGQWLAYSTSGEFLYDATDGNWNQWYERAPS